MTVAFWTGTPWAEKVADTRLAHLAWDLRLKYQADRPAHLAIETLADELRDRYDLPMPVGVEDALRLLQELGLWVEITRTTRSFHARWEGKPTEGRFVVYLSDWDAETRQTLSLLHELYEILREYFHAFNCARFPPGMKREDYVCEEMARRFSAAVCLPRGYVLAFIQEHGLDVRRLAAESGRSHACVIRRLKELLGGKKLKPARTTVVRLQPGEKLKFGHKPQVTDDRHPDDLPLLGYDVPFLCVRYGIRADLLMSLSPRFVCIEHVRSHHFSLRRRWNGSRPYLIPRKGEEWTLGPLAERVLHTGEPVFAPLVQGFDLLGIRDLCVLAVPERKNGHVVSVALYATPAAHLKHWTPVVERLQCEVLPPVVGLAGVPIKVAPRRIRKTLHGDLVDVWEVPLRSGKVKEVPRFAPFRTEIEQAEDERRHTAAVHQDQVQLLYIEEDRLLIPPLRGATPAEAEPEVAEAEGQELAAPVA